MRSKEGRTHINEDEGEDDEEKIGRSKENDTNARKEWLRRRYEEVGMRTDIDVDEGGVGMGQDIDGDEG